MKLLLDDSIDDEITEYLLGQPGINTVKINRKDFKIEMNITHDTNITPLIILKHIELFQKNEYSTLLEFDKVLTEKNKTLKYTVADMCCEYCYKSLVKDLFEKDFINSVKSNFDFHKPAFNVELEIEYINYTENELIDLIKKSL